MNKDKYYPPKHAEGQFHCPYCEVYAKQLWSHIQAGADVYVKRANYGGILRASNITGLTMFSANLPEAWTFSQCEHCNNIMIWFNGLIVYPKKTLVEQPNQDLSKDIQEDYIEAANVLGDSPRSAAAILRLVLQKLCKQLGEKGENINDDIACLVKKGLNPAIQKSLDVLRITGNNAVHPGELNLTEDKERVLKLFDLINFVAQKMITEPKEINAFYEELPEGAKKAVEKRDKNEK